MNVLVNLNLNKNELQNARIQNLATAPSSPVNGQIYFNTGDNKLYVWNGTAWDTWSEDASNADTLDNQDGSYYLDRTNHTGTQLASTISDFDTQVQTNQLDELAAPTSDVDLNNNKITNVANPTDPNDAANKSYVDAAVNGVNIKDSVKVATTANITLTATQTIDSVALAVGDRVLVKNQTDASQNGIYTVASGAWVRASDSDSWDELVSSFTFVEEGTINADTAWVSTVDEGGALNTDDVTWTQFAAPGNTAGTNTGTGAEVYRDKVGSDLRFRKIKAGSNKVTVTQNTEDISVDVVEGNIAINNLSGTLGVAKGGTGATTAAAARTALAATTKFAQTIGNNAATSFVVNHNLNTTDVIVMVKEVGSGLEVVYPDVSITDANNVTVIFSVAPTTNQYRVIVIG